jgi:hypothetical protein
MDSWTKYLCSVYICMMALATSTGSDTDYEHVLRLDDLPLAASARTPIVNPPWSRSATVDAIGQGRARGFGGGYRVKDLSTDLLDSAVNTQNHSQSQDENSCDRNPKSSPLWSDRTERSTNGRIVPSGSFTLLSTASPTERIKFDRVESGGGVTLK